MPFCPKCGATVADGAAFCGTCGSSTGTGPAAPPPPPPPSPSYSYAGGGTAPSLFTRVQNILMKPKEEWPVIAQEQTSVGGLYTGYIMLLAAIPVVASFIVMSLLGSAVAIVTRIRVPVFAGLMAALVSYALALGGVYLAAFIIDKLAPTFQSQPDQLQALKLVAYAYTAAWVAGIGNLVPILGVLLVLAGAIYSIYLFYIGLPIMMRTPADKVIPYMLVAAVIIIVISVVIGLVVGAITAASIVGSRVVSGF